uniref:Uncharacterized protein n=1 Tax=Arundo donax TaxID=35708 RepID=A0A0A9A1D1_ARUDO
MVCLFFKQSYRPAVLHTQMERKP